MLYVNSLISLGITLRGDEKSNMTLDFTIHLFQQTMQ